MTCPDPRGPLVERPDFLEGTIDALQAIQNAYREYLGEIMDDPNVVELRTALDASFSGNSPVEQFAADLEVGAWEIGNLIDEALTQARWKFERVQKAQVPA